MCITPQSAHLISWHADWKLLSAVNPCQKFGHSYPWSQIFQTTSKRVGPDSMIQRVHWLYLIVLIMCFFNSESLNSRNVYLIHWECQGPMQTMEVLATSKKCRKSSAFGHRLKEISWLLVAWPILGPHMLVVSNQHPKHIQADHMISWIRVMRYGRAKTWFEATWLNQVTTSDD